MVKTKIAISEPNYHFLSFDLLCVPCVIVKYMHLFTCIHVCAYPGVYIYMYNLWSTKDLKKFSGYKNHVHAPLLTCSEKSR